MLEKNCLWVPKRVRKCNGITSCTKGDLGHESQLYEPIFPDEVAGELRTLSRCDLGSEVATAKVRFSGMRNGLKREARESQKQHHGKLPLLESLLYPSH